MVNELVTNSRTSPCYFRYWSKVFFAIVVLLLLANCSGPDCVMADDWGQNENITVSVPAVEELTDGGINVTAGAPLYIKAGGAVDLCPEKQTLDESSTPRISPQVGIWQATGFSVRAGDYFTIFVHSQENDNEKTYGSSAYMDRRGKPLTGGRGLYALILPPGQDASLILDQSRYPNSAPTSSQNSNVFWADPTVKDDTKGTTFFELWENDPDHGKGKGTGIGGFSGIAPVTGNIWLRYARTAEKGDGTRNFSMKGNWEQRWSPWRGRYAWHDVNCYNCNPGVFIPGCYALSAIPLIGPALAQACIAGYFSGCGKAEELPDLRQCKYTPKDHWVDEEYSKNTNGYEVTITTGCPGQDGMFLQGLVVQDGDIDAVQVPVFSPAGCMPGTKDCRPSIDSNGRPITKPKFFLKKTSSPAIIELDRTKGARLNEQGAFEGVVPRSGQLWFRLLDRQTKASDMLAYSTVPYPGSSGTEGLRAGCNMPGDLYYDPPNEPSGCVQNVHPEVNPTQVECNKTYIQKDGKPVSSPEFCGKSSLEKITDSLASSNNKDLTFIDQCGYKNKNCNPPVGFKGYSDNLGSYRVKVVTTREGNGFSSMANALIKPVKAILFGACRAEGKSNLNEVQCRALPAPASTVDGGESASSAWKPGIVTRIYTKLIGGTEGGANPFVSAVRAAILLYVILYAFRFMFGMIEDPQRDFAWTVLKLGVLQQMLAPSSWEFFNSHLFTLFINGINELIGIFAGQFMGLGQEVLLDPITGNVITENGAAVKLTVNNPFAFADQTLSRFFTKETWIKIFSLLAASPLGLMYLIFICVGMWFFIESVLTALILYLLALIAIGLQIALAPVFICFLLFKKTRPLFDTWLNYLVAHAMQPVFVLTALSLFNVFVFSAMYVLLHYSVCLECVLAIDKDFGLFNLKICLFKYYLPWGASNFGSVPIQFFVLLIFLIVCQAMYSFNEWMAKLAAELFTGQGGVNLSSVSSAAFSFFKTQTLDRAGSIAKSAGGKVVDAVKSKPRQGGAKE